MSGHDHEKDVDHLTGTETTGHEWDGIKELNTPMPRWWLYTMYATIIWGIAYSVVMPAWPYISGQGWTATKGTLGYTQRGSVQNELKAEESGRADLMAKIDATPLDEVLKQPELLNAALAGGRAAFAENCAGCHGAGAQGSTGYPNLQDDDWLWGGTINDLHSTISHGIRWDADSETRMSQMPAFGKDGLLTRDQIGEVSNYVLAVSGQAHDKALAAKGQAVFAENCVSCHGEKAMGDRSQGAPNLTDKVWLYGGTEKDIIATVSGSHYGVMPAWGQRLSAATVKQLAIYVYSLGGGEATPQSAMAEPTTPAPAAPAVAAPTTPAPATTAPQGNGGQK
jgi:cytochrome c oxidase cbb3-type subunit III